MYYLCLFSIVIFFALFFYKIMVDMDSRYKKREFNKSIERPYQKLIESGL